MKTWIWIVLTLETLVSITGSNITEFPAYFQFGSSTSAYQTEGGWNADGKGENIFDRMTHTHPERISDGSNADISADSYHLYMEDVQMLKNAGMNFYRFSISWSRILPNGDAPNEPGLQYYDNLINELLANGIEPVVTMYHLDLPQAIQELGGMTNPYIIEYFTYYAEVLFERYGNRVKTWITFNEPLEFCEYGYGTPQLAPFTDSPGVGNYLCAHHVLIANANVYQLYQDNYKRPDGKVGIALNCSFFWPRNATNNADIEATNRVLQFYFGQYAHPIFSSEGGYPQIMIDRIGHMSAAEGRAWSRLPEMSPVLKEFIKGKADFLGLNYYSSNFIEPDYTTGAPVSFNNDVACFRTKNPDWPNGNVGWLNSVPEGLRALLNWIRTEYNNPEVIITENGWSDSGELQDDGRIQYLTAHLQATLDAINDGCAVTGHTTWSLMDIFEWMNGYTNPFGLYSVNFDEPKRNRTPKASVSVLRNIIETRLIPPHAASVGIRGQSYVEVDLVLRRNTKN